MAFKNKTAISFGLDNDSYALLMEDIHNEKTTLAKKINQIVSDYYCPSATTDYPFCSVDCSSNLSDIYNQIKDLKECLNDILGGLRG